MKDSWVVTSKDELPRASEPRRRSRRSLAQAAFPRLEPFGRRLESLRIKCGLTQRESRRARRTNNYQDIAHANANPTPIVLPGLAEGLGVSVVDLFEPPDLPGDKRIVRLKDMDDLVAL